MKIIADTREQLVYTFRHEIYKDVEVIRSNLYTGDYSLQGLESSIALERKSVDDLTGTLTKGRERFTHECERGRGLEYFGLIIESTLEDLKKGEYRSRMNPHALMQSLASFSVKYNLHIHFAGSRNGGEYLTYSILEKFLAMKTAQAKLILSHTQQSNKNTSKTNENKLQHKDKV